MGRYADTLPFSHRTAERRDYMTELRNRLERALAGRYTIGREIGRGGMAIVYLAHDLRHDRDVALKVLRPELAATLGPDRFLLEIHLAAGLAHPHILPLHDSGDADGCLFYVMPYVPGESLRDRLEREGQLPLVESLEIAREIADALDYAHRAAVVHRDIKPENILLQSGHAVVSDFGIARAISKAGEHRTGPGIAVGTPDYMSPEQAAGTVPVDGRSDLYSLGCVLFEMLAGRPPISLTPPEGPNAGPVQPRDRLMELSLLRPSLPPEVIGVVAQLLAPRPEDRFATAAEALEALRAPGDVWTPRSLLTRRQRQRWGAGLVAAVLIAGAVVWQNGSGAALDPGLYVIVPFAHRGGAAPGLLTGDQCELLLREAFERWTGVRLVDEFLARDVRLQHGDSIPTLAEAFARAQELHSGLMLWGEVDSLNDSIIVRAKLYDVDKRRVIREKEIRLDLHLSQLTDRFNTLADSLLLGVHTAGAASGAAGTKHLEAWFAYQTGYDALTSWDLPAADSFFRRAVDIDPRYPHANFWLAQVREWRGFASTEWQAFVASALALSNGLSPSDRLRAMALQAMADGRHPQACDEYRMLLKRDSLDFLAWYGLGDCHARDRIVVRDPSSPTHWGFRGSYRSAVEAYTRALRINTSAHRAFRGDELDRLAGLLYTETDMYRYGVALTPDTSRFGAYASLDHDTLAFVPFPLAQLVRDGLEVHPVTQRAAVVRNQAALRDITAAWVRAFPEDADALEAHAKVLETMGLIRSAGSDERSAIAIIARARRAARSGEQAFRLALVETRLHLKLGEFAQARSLADSELATFADPPPAVAGGLARLAVLTGRASRGAEFLPRSPDEDSLRTSEGVVIAAPPPILEGSLALLVYAAAGGPLDSIKAFQARIGQDVENLVEPRRRTEVRQAALDLPAVLAFPKLGASPVHRSNAGGFTIMPLQWSLARGDTTSVRAALTAFIQRGQQRLPGEFPIDLDELYAELAVAIGDSNAALQIVGPPLDALPTMGTSLLDWVSQTGGFVRAMALRAELASRAGDRRTAARWANGVIMLWSAADPPLQPLVQRMHALAGN